MCFSIRGQVGIIDAREDAKGLKSRQCNSVQLSLNVVARVSADEVGSKVADQNVCCGQEGLVWTAQ